MRCHGWRAQRGAVTHRRHQSNIAGSQGQSGNPLGAALVPEDVRAFRRETPVTIARLLQKFLMMTPTELDLVSEDPATPMMDRFVISIIRRGVLDGDPMRFNMLLDRMVGKVKDPVQEHQVNFAALPRGTHYRHGQGSH